MTISSTSRVAGPFIGSGAAATFPFAFKVFDAADLAVVTLNLSTGALTTLALTTDYTVSLNSGQDVNPGGSITLTAGNLAAGLTLTITTDMAALQGVDLTNSGGFYPDVLNAALDTLTILVQQLLAAQARSLQVPITDTLGENLPAAAERANKLLMFDADGNPSMMPIAPGSGVPGSQTAVGTVNGINKVFTFTASAAATPVPLVFAGGVFQTVVGDYTEPISLGGITWQITFTNAPVIGPVTVLLLA